MLEISCGTIIHMIPAATASKSRYADVTDRTVSVLSPARLIKREKCFLNQHIGIFITKAKAAPRKTGMRRLAALEMSPAKNSGLTAAAIGTAARKAVKSMILTVCLSINPHPLAFTFNTEILLKYRRKICANRIQ